jgi:1-acyl-sn-glycerol-3-phosphate acyltransferase
LIRSLWVVLNLVVFTIPLSLLLIGYSFFGPHHRVFEWVPRFWSRRMLRASGVDVDIIGLDNVAMTRPQVITPNHVSWFDVLALAAFLPKRYRFVAKKELARVPLWGRAWQVSGHIAVDRANTPVAIESLTRAGRIVHEDASAIVIFPEGTRSPTGELQPFKKGAFMLALYNDLDIVPTAVIGTRAILPKGSWRVRPGRIIVRFGTPLRAAQYADTQRDELIARVRTEIESLLHAPVLPMSEH